MSLDFGDRLNVITGDNGLGKSFLLDVIWRVLTGGWLADLHPLAMAGRKARPNAGAEGVIEAGWRCASGRMSLRKFKYVRAEGKWVQAGGRPPESGLVFYAMDDGGFAVWDPARNYWKDDKSQDTTDRLPAYVFAADEIGNGQKQGAQAVCKGLIEDYSNVNFQQKGGLDLLKKTLERLSPEGKPFTLGPTTRISVTDTRDIPTIRMPYATEGVPIINVSSAIKRILALAYVLVWAWIEHQAACRLRGEEPTRRITFLIDEVEAHLHPRWQRTILPSLMAAIGSLTGDTEVKLVMTTHSPLVMASCEDVFDDKCDRWFGLVDDGEAGGVLLTRGDFEKQGAAEAWLTSKAFDLKSVRSAGAEAAIREASDLLASDTATREQLAAMESRLAGKLSSHDPYWVRWRWLSSRQFSTDP